MTERDWIDPGKLNSILVPVSFILVMYTLIENCIKTKPLRVHLKSLWPDTVDVFWLSRSHSFLFGHFLKFIFEILSPYPFPVYVLWVKFSAKLQGWNLQSIPSWTTHYFRRKNALEKCRGDLLQPTCHLWRRKRVRIECKQKNQSQEKEREKLDFLCIMLTLRSLHCWS